MNPTLFMLALVAPKQPDEWVKVAYTGSFKTHPQGPFQITRADLEAMAANFTRDPRGRVVIDFNHQTIHAARGTTPEGKAPAAGWMVELQLRETDAGPELWGRPEWTSFGALAIEQGEYQYLSPTIIFQGRDRRTGAAVGAVLHSVALTNSPYLNELPPVASTDTEDSMSLRLALLTTLALADTATDDDILARVQREHDERKAGLDALGLSADASAEAVREAAQRHRARAAVGDLVFRELKLDAGATGERACAAVLPTLQHAGFVPQADHDRVKRELADLKAAGTTTALVDRAKAAGKVTPAMEPWAQGYAATDPAGFEQWMAAAPALIEPANRDRKGPAGGAAAPGTDAETALCEQLGITLEQLRQSQQQLDTVKGA